MSKVKLATSLLVIVLLVSHVTAFARELYTDATKTGEKEQRMEAECTSGLNQCRDVFTENMQNTKSIEKICGNMDGYMKCVLNLRCNIARADKQEIINGLKTFTMTGVPCDLDLDAYDLLLGEERDVDTAPTASAGDDTRIVAKDDCTSGIDHCTDVFMDDIQNTKSTEMMCGIMDDYKKCILNLRCNISRAVKQELIYSLKSMFPMTGVACDLDFDAYDLTPGEERDVNTAPTASAGEDTRTVAIKDRCMGYLQQCTENMPKFGSIDHICGALDYQIKCILNVPCDYSRAEKQMLIGELWPIWTGTPCDLDLDAYDLLLGEERDVDTAPTASAGDDTRIVAKADCMRQMHQCQALFVENVESMGSSEEMCGHINGLMKCIQNLRCNISRALKQKLINSVKSSVTKFGALCDQDFDAYDLTPGDERDVNTAPTASAGEDTRTEEIKDYCMGHLQQCMENMPKFGSIDDMCGALDYQINCILNLPCDYSRAERQMLIANLWPMWTGTRCELMFDAYLTPGDTATMASAGEVTGTAAGAEVIRPASHAPLSVQGFAGGRTTASPKPTLPSASPATSRRKSRKRPSVKKETNLSIRADVIGRGTVLVAYKIMGMVKPMRLRVIYKEVGATKWMRVKTLGKQNRQEKHALLIDLKQNTTYWFAVKAKMGKRYKKVLTHVFIPPMGIGAPSNLAATQLTDTSIQVTWRYDQPISVIGYKVIVSDSDGPFREDYTTKTETVVWDLKKGHQYVIEVAAFGSTGLMEFSAPIYYPEKQPDPITSTATPRRTRRPRRRGPPRAISYVEIKGNNRRPRPFAGLRNPFLPNVTPAATREHGNIYV